MLDLSTKLKWYKREDVQKAILLNAQEKEIAVRYGEQGFGKRPDTLKYPADVLEFAKQGATSFHCSEERWYRVLDLTPEMGKEALDQNRKAWDLVLDIDCPYWKLSKIVTWLFLEALKEHGMKSVTVKFSGNKGFHIGVPFEAFPSLFHGNPISSLFPDAPRAIAAYLLEMISREYVQVNNDTISFGRKKQHSYTIKELAEITGLPLERLTKRICSSCKRTLNEEKRKVILQFEFLCPRCDTRELGEDTLEEYRNCKKCGTLMERMSKGKKEEQGCSCGNTSSYHIFDPSSFIEVDTILLASRHMYRMSYSLHEKSGLVSIPIDPEQILSFEKEQADPVKCAIGTHPFLTKEKTLSDEGKVLLEKAFSFIEAQKQKRVLEEQGKQIFSSLKKEFDKPSEAVPEELFPPCIKLILAGLKDGRKRAVFILINFLKSAGWDYDTIEEKLIAWNKKNGGPLREVTLKGQLRYHKAQQKEMLPPNCEAKQYYVEMGVCQPDHLCSKIKNPVNYALRKAQFLRMQEQKAKKGKRISKKDSLSPKIVENKTGNE